MRKSSISLRALIAGLALCAPGAALAACPNVVPGQHAFAGLGENCVAPAGTYNPTPTTGILPFTDPGYGLLAYGNGQLSSGGAVTVNEANPGAAAVAAGEYGVLTLTQGATLNVTNASAYGVETLNGGTITLGATGVTTTVTDTAATAGNGTLFYTSQSGASISATNVNSSFSGGGGGVGVLADLNAAIAYTGGSINSSGDFVVNASARNSATLTLNGTSLTASGNGGNTLWASNGGTVSGVNLTLSATGGSYTDPSGNVITSGGASNNAYSSTVTGGTLNLTTSSITATGYGVYTANGGVTTLTGDTISVSSDYGTGVNTQAGSRTTINGGSVSTSGFESTGLLVNGNGATLTTGLNDGSPLTVTTSGVGAVNVQALNGASANLQQTVLNVSGNGAQAIYVANGATLTGSGLNITSTGTYDSGTGFNAGGVSNNASSGYTTSGGTMTLSNSTIKVTGAQSFGVYTADGGQTALTNVAVTATGANGVGVQIGANGQTTMTGGSITAAGDNTFGIEANGSNATVTATNVNIATSGNNYGIAVLAQSGGVATVTGGTESTSGNGSVAAAVTPGGTLKMSGVTLSTTGDGSAGVVLNGSTTVFTGDRLTITTSGSYYATQGSTSYGFYNGSYNSYSGGGTAALSNSSIVTSGVDAGGVKNADGGQTTLTNVQIATSGAGAKGVANYGTTSVLTGSGLTISTSGGPDANGNHAAGVYNGNGNGPSGGSTGGGTVNLTNITVSTTGDTGYGVSNNNGGAMTLTGGSITTQNRLADAVYATSGSTTTLSGLTLTTSGNAAKGIDLEGSDSKLTGANLVISTSGTIDAATGFHAQGVYNGAGTPATAGVSAGGALTLTDTQVTTSGVNAFGVNTANSGVTTFNGGSIATSAAGADAVLSVSGGSTTIGLDANGAATQISTSGASAAAVVADTMGSITITGATVTAAADGASGLVVTDAGSSMTATNVTVSTQGGIDTGAGSHANAIYNGPGLSGTSGGTLTLDNVTASTSGYQASALETGTGGTTTVTGGAFKTTGVESAAALVQGAGSMTLSGATLTSTGDGSASLVMHGTGGTITASNLTIVASGGVNASDGARDVGVYNGPFGSVQGGGTMTITDSTVTTSGVGGHGVVGAAGTTTFLGGSIATTGDGAQAAVAYSGAVLTIGTDASGAGTKISTSGGYDANAGYADAVVAGSGATVTITGATVSTTGVGANGLTVVDAGSSLTATNVTVTTTADANTTSNLYALGAYNGPAFDGVNQTTASGGTMTLNNVSISTSGYQSHAVVVETGGVTTIAGGVFSTTGAQAVGVDVGAGGAATLTGGAVKTTGDYAFGLLASDGGSASASAGATISTAGVAAFGAAARNGGVITATGAAITTTGDGATGIIVSGAGSSFTGSNLTISTSGNFSSASNDTASGVYNGPTAWFAGASAGGTVTLTEAVITTRGDDAAGVYTSAGATSLTGGSITTSGGAASGVVDVNGATTNLNNVTIAASGAGSSGLYVSDAGSSAALTGDVSVSVGGASAAGVYVGGGAVLTSGIGGSTGAPPGSLTITSAGYGVYLDGSSATLANKLTLTTTGANYAALTLNGADASFSGTGGGTIAAGGTAIALLNGAGQSASFSNYNIQSAGDLIFADPATSTVTFTDTTANAGTGNLADVTNGSNLTLNANGSTLTGAVVTTPGSVSNVTLSNGSSWTITGNSTVTNLALNNSSAAFSPANGFKTLTTTNFAGTNGLLTFNVALSGANPGADQLVIDGGRATGTTTIAIHSTTTGSPTVVSVPLIKTTNEGSIAPGAFALSGPVVVGGYIYTLQDQSGGENLVATQGLSSAQASGSLAALAQSRQTQAVTGRVLGSILTGATEQINCSSCSSGFASFGSFALGAHGRWTLSPSVSLLAGLSYDNYSGKGVSVNNALLAAMALRYDAVQLGRYRPFVEAGVAAEPYSNVTYKRSYQSLLGPATSTGDTLSRSAGLYGRVGYIWRLSRTDEAAAYTDLTRSWQWTGGYVESAAPGNPFGGQVAPSLDTMNVWRIGAQYTHLFGEHIEADLSLGYARAFDAKYGSVAAISGFGDASGFAPASFDWAEIGGRISYRFSRNVTGDLFVLSTLGAEPAGSQVHGGVALRMAF
jgi:hypothetical protein